MQIEAPFQNLSKPMNNRILQFSDFFCIDVSLDVGVNFVCRRLEMLLLRKKDHSGASKISCITKVDI
jgi:hypothetical protein